MSISSAAGRGDLIMFALSVAGVIIGLLMAIVWYFVRLRVRQNEKEKDVLERRLCAGSERMERLEKDLHDLGKDVQSRVYDDFVTKTTFNKAQDEQKEKTAALEKKIEDLKEGQTQTIVTLTQIQTRMEAGFKHLTNLLSKKITIKNQDGDL